MASTSSHTSLSLILVTTEEIIFIIDREISGKDCLMSCSFLKRRYFHVTMMVFISLGWISSILMATVRGWKK